MTLKNRKLLANAFLTVCADSTHPRILSEKANDEKGGVCLQIYFGGWKAKLEPVQLQIYG
jgi:hypothetical protein